MGWAQRAVWSSPTSQVRHCHVLHQKSGQSGKYQFTKLVPGESIGNKCRKKKNVLVLQGCIKYVKSVIHGASSWIT